MSVTPKNHSSQAVSDNSDSYEGIQSASQPTNENTVNSEKGSQSEIDSYSRASRKSSELSRRKLSSKALSEKRSLAHSDLVKEKLANLVLSSGTRSRDERVEYSYPKGKWTDEKESPLQSSISDRIPGLKTLKSENGKKRVDDWKEHGLSSEDMRKKLFSSFKSKGILNGAKIQIRADLASAINEKQILKAPKKSKLISFASKISDCIVAEHLKRADYEYTLSVFKAESLLSEFDFHPHEILDMMKLSADSKVYQNLLKCLSQARAKGFLWNFISEMIPGRTGTTASVGCQTEGHIPLTSREIDMKMLEIEKDVMARGRSSAVESSLMLEEKLFEMQKKMEAHKKKELDIEKQQLKDGLLREVRLEERKKSNAEFDKQKIELEKLYKERFVSLMEKEKEMNLMNNQMRKQIDMDAYNQRQNLLEELSKVKEREGELQRQHDLAMKLVETEETRLRTLAEELKVKEMSQKTLEERYELKFQEEILRFKSEQQQDKQKIEGFYKLQEAKLNEEKALFQREKVSLIRYQKEFEALQYKNSELQESLHSSQQRSYSMSQKIEDMKEKIETMVDYPKLKEKIILKDREIDHLKGSLHEIRNDKSFSDAQHRKDVKELIDKFLRGSPDTAKLQQQMLQERDEYLEKENRLKLKCKEVTKRLQEECLKNEEMMHTYEECLLQNKALKREIGDLKKTTSENVPRSDNVNSRNLKPYEYKKTKSSTHFVPFINKGFSEEQGQKQAYNVHEAVSFPQVTSVDRTAANDYGMAQNERAQVNGEYEVFEKLEREAANLEKMYNNFRANQIDRFSRESDFEKPSTNEFKPLQKYESTLKQDFSKMYLEAEKGCALEVVLEKGHREKDSSSRHLDYSGEMKHMNVRDDLKEGRDAVRTVGNTNVPHNTASLDENHLTEQLLETANNQSSKVNTKLDFDSKSDASNDFNGFDKMNVQTPDTIASQSHEEVVNGDSSHLVRKGWELHNSLQAFENDVDSTEKLEDRACSVEERHVNEGGEKEAKQIDEEVDIAREHSNQLKNESNKEVYRVIDEGSYGGNSVESNRSDHYFEEEYKPKEISFMNRDNLKDQGNMRNEDVESNNAREEDIESTSVIKEDVEKNSTKKEDAEKHSTRKEADNDIRTDVHNSLKSESNEDKSNENNKEKNYEKNRDENEENAEEDDGIDPLMKQYMEMVMKKKTMTEKESEKEHLNLTDDTKIESKLTRSDISDLMEDNIEEIQMESGDEFDW